MSRKLSRKTKKAKRMNVIAPIGNAKTLVTFVDVDNPGYSRAHDGASANPRKLTVPYSVRESPLAVMYHQRKSIDEAQYAAGNRFRSLFERTGGSGAQAMDYTKEPVDGGIGPSDGLTEARMDAAKELSRVEHLLGPQGYRLVRTVCGELIFLKDYEPRRHFRDGHSLMLKHCLTIMAEFWGLQTKGRRAG